MLGETQTLGAGAYEQLYIKRFADNNKSTFSVSGLNPNATRELLISHETLSNGRVRSMISLNNTDVNPNAPSGTTGLSRVYLVIDRQPWKTAADVKGTVGQLNSIVDSIPFLDAILNREV